MVISYLGGACVKVSQGELTLAFNPPSKDSSLKSVRFGADITLVSQQHPDYNGVENTAYGDREPFVITGPGEYEIKGVAVRGFASPGRGPGALNTIYSVALEGMNLCFLGALGEPHIPTAAKQELDDIDILFLPIGGDGVLDHAEGYKLAVGLEPKAIIPIHYGAAALMAFLKEAGAEGVEPIEKLTLKKKDLEGKEAEIIILAA